MNTVYEWSSGNPAQTDNTNYEWSGGKPYILYDNTEVGDIDINVIEVE